MKRLNAKGALWALGVGFAMGLFRLAIDTPVALSGATYEPNSFLWIVNSIFFQYYSILILLVSATVMIAVSYSSAPPSYAQIQGLTFGTLSSEDRAANKASYTKNDIIASILVLLLIIAAYVYFSG